MSDRDEEILWQADVRSFLIFMGALGWAIALPMLIWYFGFYRGGCGA